MMMDGKRQMDMGKKVVISSLTKASGRCAISSAPAMVLWSMMMSATTSFGPNLTAMSRAEART